MTKIIQTRTPHFSAGHSPVAGRDRGTSGNGLIEGVETARIVKRTVEICKQKYGLNVRYDYGDTILADIVRLWNRITTKNCFLVEFHFNSVANTAVRGVETFVPNDASDFEVKAAFCFSEVLHVVLGGPKRGNFRGNPGVRPESEAARGTLGWMRILGENILPEVEFMSNKAAMDTYNQNFERLCQDFAQITWYICTDQIDILLEAIKTKTVKF